MTPFLTKRLLINMAVVVAAVGANAFVAYTQICGQRDADARMLRSTNVRQNLDAYQATLAGIERDLRVELAGEPAMLAALARLSADSQTLQHDLDDALVRSAQAEPDTSRTWAASAYTHLGLGLNRVEAGLAALRGEENRALKASLAASASETRRATLLLILTMLAGSALLIFTFGARENSAREKLRSVRALGRNDERFRSLFDDHPVPMYIFDRETLRFLAVNAAAIQQYGYTESEFLRTTIRAIRPDTEVPRLESHLQRSDAVPHGRTMAGIWHHRRKDGSMISADISYHALNFMGRAAFFVLADDVTEQINAEAEAQRSNQMLETVIDNIPQRIFWKDQESRYLGCNMAFARDAGLAYPEQVVGKSDGRVIGVLGSYTDITERKRADLALRLQSRALDASVNAILITAPSPAGNLIEYVNPAFMRITGYDPTEVIGHDCRVLQRDDRDQEGVASIRQALAANREVSAVVRNYRKDGALFWNQLFIAPVPNAEGVITHHIGVINDVTDLMRYRLQHALIVAQRQHKGVAVVFIDLDGFKNVNDSLGHSVGDRLLSVVAERLARCTRTSDTVARHGGDEFVIVMTDTVDEQSLIAWMERVRASISEPVWLDGTELYVGCSTFQFYQPEMNASVGARLNLERRLRRALRDNEFLLHYQPQVDIESGQIVGTEALVRWRDPEVGLVPPSSFIPVAEESGLIGPLSEWVLREACRQNKAWQDEGLPPARVSVNLSARVFQQRDIAKLVMQVLAETGLEPQYLELELTESTIMRNAEEAVSMLNELHALGIGLAIDDFGTGYSSLSYLKRFPVDRLKIDRSFVSDIGESSDDETITSAIIALAHSLNLQVIAEGVETSTQLDFLKERACDEMQGYFFAKPLPHDAIPGMLQRGAENAAMIAANA